MLRDLVRDLAVFVGLSWGLILACQQLNRWAQFDWIRSIKSTFLCLILLGLPDQVRNPSMQPQLMSGSDEGL